MVRFTSRAKSCMCRISAVMTSRTRGDVFGPIALITVSVKRSIESSAIIVSLLLSLCIEIVGEAAVLSEIAAGHRQA